MTYTARILKALKHIYTFNTLVLSKTLNKCPWLEVGLPPQRDLKDIELGGGELDSSVRESQKSIKGIE